MNEAMRLANEIAKCSLRPAVSVAMCIRWGRSLNEGGLYRAIYKDEDAIALAINGADAAEGHAAFLKR